MKNKKICSRCIYDESVSAITFDSNGVCNYCHQIDQLINSYGTGTSKGLEVLDSIINKIKKEGKGKKYDCVVGVSGGTDSSYMLHWAVEKGLRPLAVHYDNTWNTAIATENIRKVLSGLNIDLYTHVVDNKEIDDILLAFFKSGVPELEAANDLALAETLYKAASKYKISYILEGHSFVTEGISPLGKNYFDGKYIKSIHNRFGAKKMSSYPLMTFTQFMKWIIYYRIKKIRPLWYLDYNKEEAKRLLAEKYDWKDYGGHHLENRSAVFTHSVYYPVKFSVDFRNNSLSALVRNGQLPRDTALQIYYHEKPKFQEEIIKYFKKRLGLSDDVYDKIMHDEPKYWYEFPTYKKRFEKLRPLFFLLMKSHLVPHSFYLKYCFPAPKNNS